MKSLHLTLALFCHVLLASLVFYFTSQAAASPLEASHKPLAVATEAKQSAVQFAAKVEPVQHKSKVQVVAEAKAEPRSAVAPAAPVVPVESAQPQKVVEAAISPVVVHHVEPAKSMIAQPELVGRKAEVSSEVIAEEERRKAAPSVVIVEHAIKPEEVQVVKELVEAKSSAPSAEPPKVDVAKELEAKKVSAFTVVEPMKPIETPVVKSSPEVAAPVEAVVKPAVEVVPVPQSLTIEHRQPVTRVESPAQESVAKSAAPLVQEDKKELLVAQQAPPAALEQPASKPVAPVPVVMGGLGPLHLLATTLCSYQPDKPVADEHLNQLYARRASVRKSLFEFMSLKFTNLEKLSSRLGYGLQVVPVALVADSKISSASSATVPSHGWPVVGKCTAHDLKLMGEAAWCECQEGGDQSCAKQPATAAAPVDPTVAAAAAAPPKEEQPAKVVEAEVQSVAQSSRTIGARSILPDSKLSFLPSPDESSVISKLLHVSDIKDAPTVESSIYNLNLTQHQLATLEAHATSTQECRRNSLRYTKALFNHLAEDQHEQSNSWPQLYALISADDCARKRMIDIVNALSGFRTDTTSIRRDNLEFAFAMDDLRAKVLESEVNIPLTFDRHFIEVEQFLQQSVRLMLANVQPKRAKLTSLRYRSLMYGASQQAFDDQCIDLHQRLLAKNYPNDCNPTQFGQLPDVLRMTASSLELWSIEKELSLRTARVADYPNSTAVGQQKVKEDVNECIANLVSS